MIKRTSSMDSTPPNVIGLSPNTMPKISQDLRNSYGTNWTKANVSVLFEWISIASYNIRCLEMATNYYRKQLRANIIIGLVLATASGTINTAETVFMNGVSTSTTLVLNIILIVMAFTIAIMTGYIKIYQVQENLEHSIKVKQEWIVFSADIASELQLPTQLRRDALWIIIKNKNIYLELLKTNLEIPECIIRQARKDFKEETKLNMDVSSLPRILIDIGVQEMRDLEIDNKDDRISSVAKKQLKHLATFQPKGSAVSLAAIIEEERKLNKLELEVKKELKPTLREALSTSSVKSDHQVVTLNMDDSPTHPHLEVRPA
jgi:hypothetical protein